LTFLDVFRAHCHLTSDFIPLDGVLPVSVVTVPEYTPHKYRTAMIAGLIALLISIFLIGMSVATVGEMTGYCQIQKNYLLVNTGNPLLISPGNPLLIDQTQTRHCELNVWNIRFELSERAEAALRKIGVPFFNNLVNQ
jgi:hypothetical protein